METKAQEAVAARIKQAEEKEKAKQKEKARHEAAVAALDEEYAMAEKYQTRRLEAAKEDTEKVKEQYQRDLQKIDTFLANHPGLAEPPTTEVKKEKPPITLETITKHLHADTTLTGLAGGQLTPELIASSLMDLVRNLNQEPPAADETMEQKGEARATKRPVSPKEADKQPKEPKLPKIGDDDEF